MQRCACVGAMMWWGGGLGGELGQRVGLGWALGGLSRGRRVTPGVVIMLGDSVGTVCYSGGSFPESVGGETGGRCYSGGSCPVGGCATPGVVARPGAWIDAGRVTAVARGGGEAWATRLRRWECVLSGY